MQNLDKLNKKMGFHTTGDGENEWDTTEKEMKIRATSSMTTKQRPRVRGRKR